MVGPTVTVDSPSGFARILQTSPARHRPVGDTFVGTEDLAGSGFADTPSGDHSGIALTDPGAGETMVTPVCIDLTDLVFA